ncbi:TetR/AcrR family transcriptional regulator [Streptomyces sp. WMMB 322]|uniref:TetR/AcrR family transcriptional regulator n=1 Tax=Streptomyces sp. WMMB 322 TaxID=1286821 RepID=UPI000823820F|nr:TetR/AcrR family transcriptional regulator [Streptomyces sp. WMMB 322]SCK06888.1 transcriptional regulator, TetR family [Streptomyces sp. WMMB 322]
MTRDAGGEEGHHRVPGSTRPGGRTARTREAVREATLAEIAERGYDALTVEGVAARAGVHRATVHRRWRNAAGLAADVLDLASGERWPVPDTGSIKGDLRELTSLVVTHFEDPRAGSVSRALASAAVHDPVTARALHGFLAGRHRQAAPIVVRAVERGELPGTTDAEEVVRAAVAPLYYRLFISGEPAGAETAQRAADAALAAARAGVFVRGAGGSPARGAAAGGTSGSANGPAGGSAGA